MTKLLTVLSLLLASCAGFKYEATAPGGGTEKMQYFAVGGSEAMETAGGTRYAGNRVKSFGQFNQTVAAGLALWAGAYSKNSDNTLTATQSTNATKQAVETTRANAALEAAKIKATPVITEPPKQAIFPP